jgi:two-component system, chemotaxis family, protein-glutamate methylesterase/glutaminase
MASNQIILIGGSAGSLPILIGIIKQLPTEFPIPVVIVLHRQRNVVSEMQYILGAVYRHKQIIEPDDKEPINDCCIYLAPQNYHLLVEPDKTFSLDYSEVVRYSRPSIDVTFESAAMVYRKHVTAVILSGANNDGAAGMQAIAAQGGTCIVQDPATAEYGAMPTASLHVAHGVKVLSPNEIWSYLCSLKK